MVALFALVMGIAMAGIWTLDIRAGRGFEPSAGLIHAREVGTGSRLVWHWLAEYGTAATLIVAGLLLLMDAALALPVAFIGLGALAYSACNSLSWALARRSDARMPSRWSSGSSVPSSPSRRSYPSASAESVA